MHDNGIIDRVAVRLKGAASFQGVEAKPADSEFVEQWWDGSHGALDEMTQGCDWDSDCSCWDLHYKGAGYDAAARGSIADIADAFDWKRLVGFQALERVLNHPDSYSLNLNNFHVCADPIEHKLSLSPWGASRCGCAADLRGAGRRRRKRADRQRPWQPWDPLPRFRRGSLAGAGGSGRRVR